ncbi:MAG: ATP-binding protein [Streptomycetaceae bacterium]|nr:ATP-binding protein [Streptomycetaceae bacterium]
MFTPPATCDDLRRALPRRIAARVVARRRERGRRVAITLDTATTSVPAAARRFVREAAQEWQLPSAQADDLVLIVSELATNALIHTRTSTVTVVVACLPGAVVVSVTDRGPHKPLAVPAADNRAEHGRGLHIVDALSQRWGHARTGTGTRVWARVAVSCRGGAA